MQSPIQPGQSGESAGQAKTRAEIPDRYRWNLADLYPGTAEWTAEKNKLRTRFPDVARFRGTLGSSARNLADCLALLDEIGKTLMRLAAWAGMNSDQDTRDAGALGIQTGLGQLGTEFSALASFIEPEILAAGPEAVERFLAEEKRLSIHAHFLRDLQRRRGHTGTPGEERIIAEAGLMSDGPGDINGIFTNADFPYPDVTLSSGASVTLNQSGFSLHRASKVRQDRKAVFDAYFSSLGKFRRTFGTQINAQIRRDLFYSRARNYPSCLEAALHGDNIPVAVYRNLIATVNDGLPVFHRYLRLRAKLLKLPSLAYSDLYAPLVAEADREYGYDEASGMILSSLAPLGKEYGEAASLSFTERWIDVYPTPGKRSGAYSNGIAYDVHPYILLNYNGRYDDVSTITHELGHTMHSYLSNRGQPFATSRYSIFVAEVASTLNEALLFDHILGTITEPKERLSILGRYLEHYKATVFRQTQFAEFELAMHTEVEEGRALTGDTLTEIYLKMVRRYYGHAEGVCAVDDVIGVEWAHIPHFFYNFYVYQYATSFCASSAIAERLLSGDADTVRHYLELLSSGGSDYPIELLKRAGVDMTTATPVKAAIAKMDAIIDEMEAIAP